MNNDVVDDGVGDDMTPEQATKLVTDQGAATVIVGVFIVLVLAMFGVLLKQNSAMFNRIIHGTNGNSKEHPVGALMPRSRKPTIEVSLASMQEEITRLADTMATRPCMVDDKCPIEETPDWLKPEGGA